MTSFQQHQQIKALPSRNFESTQIDVLGIPLYAAGISNAVEEILRYTREGRVTTPQCISATGAHGLVFAQKKPSFRNLLRGFFINLPDGMPAVWVGRAKGAKRMKRCYGPDFFEALMRESATTDMRHFLCGGKEGVAESLKQACAEKFGNSNIVGTHCPPFRPLSEQEFENLGQEIDSRRADVVWIGISTPKQEYFAAELARYTHASFIITVGAAFDFHIGAVRQAPVWIQRAGLEWFFRLMMEPKRLYKRYLEIVPLFLFYNVKEFLFARKRRKLIKHI